MRLLLSVAARPAIATLAEPLLVGLILLILLLISSRLFHITVEKWAERLLSPAKTAKAAPKQEPSPAKAPAAPKEPGHGA